MIYQIFWVIILILLMPNVGTSNVLFTDITINAGINYSGRSEGICVFDYNNDGWDDILFTTRNGNRLYLYENNTDMEFIDVTTETNLGLTFEGRTPVAGDYDNDGDLDLFIGAVVGESYLFQNDGSGSFQDVTSISGINVSGQVRGCSWVDYNADGYLDLYVGMLLNTNKYFKNNGDGTFVDVAQNIGAAGPIDSGVIMGLGFIDYDRDGDQDLYILQDNNLGNILLKYENFGQYIDVSMGTQTDLEVMGMGVAFGDIDRDGLFDIYMTNLYENSLLLNNESGVFADISASSGSEDTPGSMGWGTFFFDANNDGWVDIYNNNESFFDNVPNSLLINNGDSTFTEMGEETGTVLYNNGFGSSFADFDHDGDMDMVLVGHPSSIGSINLLRNDSELQNWIILILSQAEQNKFAIGSTIELYHNNVCQLNFIGAGNGYCSQNTFEVHYGLGQELEIDSAIVYWPDGSAESFSDLIVNERNQLNRGLGNTLLQSNYETTLPEMVNISNVYPNPFNNHTTLEIKIESESESNISIFDLKGQMIYTDKVQLKKKIINNIDLDLSGIPSGIYFINVNVNEFSNMMKITLLK